MPTARPLPRPLIISIVAAATVAAVTIGIVAGLSSRGSDNATTPAPTTTAAPTVQIDTAHPTNAGSAAAEPTAGASPTASVPQSTDTIERPQDDGSVGFSDASEAELRAFASEAVTAWISYRTEEPADDRAARLRPYLDETQLLDTPVLAREQLERTEAGFTATVDVIRIEHLTASTRADTADRITYLAQVTTTATWQNPNRPAATSTRAGTDNWWITIPWRTSDDGTQLERDPDARATIEEPDLDF